MDTEDYHFKFKFIILGKTNLINFLGDKSVGKTALLECIYFLY